MAEKADQPKPADTGDTYTSRPGVVTLICILTFIGAAWQIIQFVLFAAGRFQPGGVEYLVTLVVLGLFSGLLLAMGLGMWHAKNWARILFVVLIPLLRLLDLVNLPNPFSALALVVVLVLAVLLFRPPASAYFRGIPSPAIDPASGLSQVPREIVRCPSCGKEIYSTVVTCHHYGADTRAGTTA